MKRPNADFSIIKQNLIQKRKKFDIRYCILEVRVVKIVGNRRRGIWKGAKSTTSDDKHNRRNQNH